MSPRTACQEGNFIGTGFGESLSEVWRKIRATTGNNETVGRSNTKRRSGGTLSWGQNLEESKKSGELALELVDALLMAPSATKDSVLDEIRERIPKLDEGQIEYNNTIRFDLRLSAPFPFDSPQQLWIDHGIVHETSESYQESMVHLESGLAALR